MRWPVKWTKKLFFHLLEFTILNIAVILASCGSKSWQWLFRLTVRDVIQETGKVPQTQTTRQERHAPSVRQLSRTDTRYNKHWSLKLVAVRVLLKTNQQEQNSSLQNTTWGCVLYHTKLHFQGPTKTKLEKQSTHTHAHISKYFQLLLNWYFSIVFCDEMTGMKGVWILQKALWKNRKLLEGPVCVYLFSLATLRKWKVRSDIWRHL